MIGSHVCIHIFRMFTCQRSRGSAEKFSQDYTSLECFQSFSGEPDEETELMCSVTGETLDHLHHHRPQVCLKFMFLDSTADLLSQNLEWGVFSAQSEGA